MHHACRTPLESLLERSWMPLGAEESALEASWSALGASWDMAGAPRIEGTRPGRVIQLVLGRGGEEPGGGEQANRPLTARLPGLLDYWTVGLGYHYSRTVGQRKVTLPRSRMPLASRGRRI